MSRTSVVAETSPYGTARGGKPDILTSKDCRCHLLTLCHRALRCAWAVPKLNLYWIQWSLPFPFLANKTAGHGFAFKLVIYSILKAD